MIPIAPEQLLRQNLKKDLSLVRARIYYRGGEKECFEQIRSTKAENCAKRRISE